MTSDPEQLAAVVRSTAADRGTDRGDVAMSLFVQGYAFRVASIAIGAWLLDDIVVDVAPRRCAIALGRNRPNSVHFDELRAVSGGDPLAALHEVLVEGHLAPLLDNARAACPIGEPLLWSNVGAACVSSFGAFMLARRDLHGEIRNRFEAFLPPLGRSSPGRGESCRLSRCGRGSGRRVVSVTRQSPVSGARTARFGRRRSGRPATTGCWPGSTRDSVRLTTTPSKPLNRIPTVAPIRARTGLPVGRTWHETCASVRLVIGRTNSKR